LDERIKSEKKFHDDRFTIETRETAHKYYSIERNSRETFLKKILEYSKNKNVLELGCGKGSYSLKIAQNDGRVTGIDISEVAIKFSEEQSRNNNVSEVTTFLVMNAENLDFQYGSFDLVIGSSIVHHLELQTFMNELVQVLNNKGSAIFIEPLGHNLFINLYRNFTPNLRTKDEHPLLLKDLKYISSFFNKVEINYFHFFTLLAVPLRKMRFFNSILSTFEKLDQILFRMKVFRKFAWQVVITLSHPK